MPHALRGARAPKPATEVRVWKSGEPVSEDRHIAAEDPVREEQEQDMSRDRTRRGSDGMFNLSEEVRSEIDMAGPAASSPADRLARAAEAYRRDRYPDALRILTRLRRDVRSPVVEELFGLTCYRMGRWKEAARHLARVSAESGSFDQYPVLMDCHRAMGNFGRVREIYEELRRESPPPELLVEGRIVLAQSIADGDDIPGAIAILARAGRKVAHPRPYHVRQWYVLGDLYERAGDLLKATAYFRMVVESGEESYDAADRLGALA